MEDLDESTEIFCQDGVLLTQAPASYITFMNTVGTVAISESLNLDQKKFIEWKPNDVTVDSNVQDQEWEMVNTVHRRIRTLSGNLPPDYNNQLRHLKIGFDEFKSFHVLQRKCVLTFLDGKGDSICTLRFLHGNCELFIGTLKRLLPIVPSKRDKHHFIVCDEHSPELQQLGRSFAELDIGNDSHTFWSMFRNIKERPYETTFEAFAKVTDYVLKTPDQNPLDEIDKEDITRSITEIQNTTSQVPGGFEVVAKLPLRREFPRLKPLSDEQWSSEFNSEGKLENCEVIKGLIFRGGVAPHLRKQVWKYLLEYYPWQSTEAERQQLIEQRKDEYFKMKLQWKSISKVQEDNFSDFRDRKSLVEKDVNRTDRNLDFFAGDDNANLQTLNDILMTYIMYNFDLGYVQGMSDLLSPILMLMQNEVDSFWCFVGFMNKVMSNFDIDQARMKEQLSNLRTLLAFADPELANYFDTHDSGNMFFCFRWLLVWFKRELGPEDVMRFWEVLWTGHPCQNFHLLVCVAVLENERATIIENNYGFNEILKHINDLSGKINMDIMLNKAEGIYYQMKEAEHLSDGIRLILGMPLIGSISNSSHELSPFESTEDAENVAGNIDSNCSSPDNAVFEQGLSNYYL